MAGSPAGPDEHSAAGARDHRGATARPGELLVAVRACGVCRTDLHVAEGDLPVHRPGVIPGHEVVAEVIEVGPEVGVDNAGRRVRGR